MPPVKISRSFVEGATPFQFPAVCQLPFGTAPPFQVTVAAGASWMIIRVRDKMPKARTIVDVRMNENCCFIME